MLKKIRVIGLTGGIATGKSSIARFFSNKKVPVIDADQLAREAVLPGSSALKKIIAQFGSKILTPDGLLDRKQLGILIFADPEKRRLLESIMHPAIKILSEKYIAAAAADGHQRIIYMAPLLIEAGITDRVDTIWVVTVRPEIQLKRLMSRDGISREQAEKIIASQMSLNEKESFGNIIIENSGTEVETFIALEAVWAKEIGRGNE